MSANDWSVKYRQVQQGALSLYVSTLDGALAPLEERYRRALGDLVDIQQTYAQELGRRLSAVYVSYAETVAAIPAGTSDLEAAAEAYRTLVEKYGQFVDPVYWGSEIAPAQQKLKQAVAQAVGNDDAKRLTQDALEVFYRDLSDLLGENGSAKGLSDAQLRYAGHGRAPCLLVAPARRCAAACHSHGLPPPHYPHLWRRLRVAVVGSEMRRAYSGPLCRGRLHALHEVVAFFGLVYPLHKIRNLATGFQITRMSTCWPPSPEADSPLPAPKPIVSYWLVPLTAKRFLMLMSGLNPRDLIRLAASENCSGWQPDERTIYLISNVKKELAGEPGFEPRLTESESVVLPLNYSPA